MTDNIPHSAGYYGAQIAAWAVAGPALVIAILLLVSGSFIAALLFAVGGLIMLGIGDFVGAVFDRIKYRHAAPATTARHARPNPSAR
jgi:hypothetical protein